MSSIWLRDMPPLRRSRRHLHILCLILVLFVALQELAISRQVPVGSPSRFHTLTETTTRTYAARRVRTAPDVLKFRNPQDELDALLTYIRTNSLHSAINVDAPLSAADLLDFDISASQAIAEFDHLRSEFYNMHPLILIDTPHSGDHIATHEALTRYRISPPVWKLDVSARSDGELVERILARLLGPLDSAKLLVRGAPVDIPPPDANSIWEAWLDGLEASGALQWESETWRNMKRLRQQIAF